MGHEALIVRSSEGTLYRQGPSLFKATGDQTAGRFDFFEMTIEYLTGPGLHWHANQDDTFYVLEGVLTVQCGEEILDLSPGDFITIPPGVPHTFDNTRKDQLPVKVINLMTPGGYHGLFAENEHLAEDADAAERDRINAKYEVTYVGPPLAEKLGLS
ncbi:cupin domain-containing protein [Micromonospora sp. NPDC047707]|uniref:cupin domain-containing protein n=1 Tax=Micromonospora sp. NPDC047707 TaxID=3154498 RepID=UPI003451A9F2